MPDTLPTIEPPAASCPVCGYSDCSVMREVGADRATATPAGQP